jgi:hypothetical protein
MLPVFYNIEIKRQDEKERVKKVWQPSYQNNDTSHRWTCDEQSVSNVDQFVMMH